MSGPARLTAAGAALTVAGLCILLGSAQAEAPAALAYRRVYVPEDALDGQIRGLLPLQREEFQRRLELARRLADPSASQTKVRIDQAVFHATLDGDRLRGGKMELVVTASDDEPSLLSLDPCNVAIEAAVWDDRRAAIVGADSTGTLRCLAPHSGTLLLDWNQAGIKGQAGETTFDLRLPAALQRRLQIATPANVELTVDGGLVSAGEPATEDPRQRLWTIDLLGGSPVVLHARPIRPQEDSGPLVTVRELATYAVWQSTLDVETTLTLDILRQPLKQIELEVDRPLQISAVALGEHRLAFRTDDDAEKRHATVLVELPAELSGMDRAIEISANADWPTGSRWTLPRVKLAGGLLQEGRAEVHAPAWLRLQARPLSGCVQTQAAPAAAARGSDRFEFQLLQPGAEIEIAADQTAAPLDETSGTQINVETNQITGVMVAELTSLGASRFAVEAQVPRQWIVDAVETQPPESLADRTLTTRGSGPQLLHLKLARALTSQRPLRVVIRAHYRRPPSQRPLAADFFRLARFPESRGGRRLISVRVNDPGAELRLADDDNLARLNPAQLSAPALRLFESPPGPLLFETGPASETLKATLEAATARFRAEVLVRAGVEPDRIEQDVAVRCQPDASAVGSLVVRLTPRPRGDVAWRLAGEGGRELPAALEGSVAANSDEAIYRLMLPRPQSSAFEVTGHWSAAPAAGDELSLAWLPEATRQTGQAEIHSLDGGLQIQAKGVQPLPRPPAPNEAFTTLRGRYQYEAGRQARIAVEPVLPGAAQTGAWIETLYLASRFGPGGGSQHEATFTIRNTGARSFHIGLPPSVSDCRLVVSEATESSLASAGTDGQIVVPLAANERKAVVRVRYSSAGAAVGRWPTGRLAAPILQTDLPVLSQTWTVSLPPGLAAMGIEPRSQVRKLSPAPKKTGAGGLLGLLSGPDLVSRLELLPQPEVETSSDAALLGWSMVRVDLPRGTEATLAVYRPAVIAAWSFCCGLIAAALVMRIRSPAAWLASAAGLLAAAAIISEPPLAWLAAGTSLGFVVGGVWRLCRCKLPGSRPTPASRQEWTTVALPAGASANILLIALCCWSAILLGSRLWAAAPDALPPAGAGDRRVVFPVDKDQEPAGEYVFLDPAFYDGLHRLTDVRPAAGPAWLLESARYELPAAPALHAGGANVDELRAVFDFHTFQAAATIHLPLRRDQILLLEGRSRLDGEAVSLAWQADGSLSLPVETAGRHRLELALGAVARRTADAVLLEMAIPAAAIATVALPANGPASGEVVGQAVTAVVEAGSRIFHLASGHHLSVRWLTPEATLAAAATLEADQLLWWKVRPGSVVLEARFRLRPMGGLVRQAVIEVDPRLRLLPGQAVGPIGRVRTEEGPANRVKVDFAEPAAGEFQFRLAWLWPEASGVGRLLLPSVRAQADRLVRDWTAISLEPGLEIGDLPASQSGPSPAEFTQAWGEAALVPTAVLAASAKDQVRPVVVRPTFSLPQAEQTIDWSISSSLAEAHCTLRLAGVPATRFEHRIAIPASVKVSRVTLTQAGRPPALRWTQQADGLLIITLLESPAAEQTLTIFAEYAPPKNRPQFRLPSIGAQDVRLGGLQLRIYRQNDVQLKIQPAAEWTGKDEREIGEYRPGLGRLAASMASGATGVALPLVTRSLNSPRLAGQMLIHASQADGDWRCEANLNLEIGGGLLDELRLSIPEEWSGPLEIEPAMEQIVSPIAGESRKQLTIRPREAVAGRLSLALRGPLHVSGAGVQAPDVAVLGHRKIERLVLLDRGSAGERIDWEKNGLSAVRVQEAPSLPAAWPATEGDLYRVVGPRFDATARVRQTSDARSHVHLADFRVTIWPARRLTIVAELAIQPAGTRDVTFRLPPGCRLIETLVDGVVAPNRASGLRSWKLAAPSDVLPFRVTIVYDTFLPTDAATRRSLLLAAPEVSGMNVERSLWSVQIGGDQPRRILQLAHAEASVSGQLVKIQAPQQAELARLEASVQALEDIIAAQGTNLPASVLSESFVRWTRLQQAILRRLGEIDGPQEAPSNLAERTQAAIDAAGKIGQRLMQAGILNNGHVTPATGADDGDEPGASVCVVGSGPINELRLSWPPDRTNAPGGQTALACALACASLLLWSLGRLAIARNWLLAHTPFLMAAAGISWWLLAPLGWLGWPLVLAAIWVSLRWPWPRNAYDADSTLHRFSTHPLR
jgi:hypothetical protein